MNTQLDEKVVRISKAYNEIGERVFAAFYENLAENRENDDAADFFNTYLTIVDGRFNSETIELIKKLDSVLDPAFEWVAKKLKEEDVAAGRPGKITPQVCLNGFAYIVLDNEDMALAPNVDSYPQEARDEIAHTKAYDFLSDIDVAHTARYTDPKFQTQKQHAKYTRGPNHKNHLLLRFHSPVIIDEDNLIHLDEYYSITAIAHKLTSTGVPRDVDAMAYISPEHPTEVIGEKAVINVGRVNYKERLPIYFKTKAEAEAVINECKRAKNIKYKDVTCIDDFEVRRGKGQSAGFLEAQTTAFDGKLHVFVPYKKMCIDGPKPEDLVTATSPIPTTPSAFEDPNYETAAEVKAQEEHDLGTNQE